MTSDPAECYFCPSTDCPRKWTEIRGMAIMTFPCCERCYTRETLKRREKMKAIEKDK